MPDDVSVSSTDADHHDGHDHHGDHGHHHDHEHHDHEHHDHEHHDHGPGGGLLGRLRHLFAPHSHDVAEKIDSQLETSRDGIRALWLSLLILGATAAAQAIVVVWSGSVALLGDT